MKHELVQMRKQGSGAIENCSSLGGLVGGIGRATYHATEHGVLGQTKSVAPEYGPLGVRVNAVCPGTLDTPMVARMTTGGELDHEAAVAAIPLGSLGQPEERGSCALAMQRRRELRHRRRASRRRRLHRPVAVMPPVPF